MSVEAATATPQASPASTPGATDPGASQQPAGAEAPPAAAAPEADHDLEWSRRFNQLSKREKMILEQARKNKEIEAKWEQQRLADEARAKKKKENPFDWLKEEGMTYEELTQFALSGGQVTPEERIAALEAKIANDEKARAEKEEAARVAAEAAEENGIKQKFVAKVSEFITGNPDFEIVAGYGQEGVSMIYDVMEQYHDQNGGEMLTIEQAAKEVEAYLEKELEKVIKSTSKVKKFIPQFEQPNSDTPPRRPNDMSSHGLDTLTHQAVTSAPALEDSGEMLSNEESLRRSAELLRKLTAGR